MLLNIHVKNIYKFIKLIVQAREHFLILLIKEVSALRFLDNKHSDVNGIICFVYRVA